jgi:hypothetical protein
MKHIKLSGGAAFWIGSFSFESSECVLCNSFEPAAQSAELPENLGDGTVVVVVLCDIVSSIL